MKQNQEDVSTRRVEPQDGLKSLVTAPGAPRSIASQRTRRTSSHIQGSVTSPPAHEQHIYLYYALSTHSTNSKVISRRWRRSLPSENAPAPRAYFSGVCMIQLGPVCLSTRPMFFVFQAMTVAFDDIPSPFSNNFQRSALEVCWRDHSTPSHRLIVCTANPPIPAKGATRATASICPTSGQPPGASWRFLPAAP